MIWRLGAVLALGLILAACNNAPETGFQGWVEADLIFVSPDENGRVQTLAVREGDAVTQGAPLFTVDDELQQANLKMAEASLTNAKAAFERAQALLRTAAGTQRALDDAQAALRTAEAQVASAQTRLSRRRAFSPASGTIQQIYYRPGEFVSAGRPVLALLPPGNIKIRFFVPEAVLPRLAIGDAVNITCDGCRDPIAARVTFMSRTSEFTPPVIYSQEERSKLVFLIEARADDPKGLRVGQPVSVNAPSLQAERKR